MASRLLGGLFVFLSLTFGLAVSSCSFLGQDSPERFTQTVPQLKAGDSTLIEVPPEKRDYIGITSVNFTMLNDAADVTLRIEKLLDIPTIEVPSEKVFSYLQISADGLPNDRIKSARILFEVPLSWFEAEQIEANNLGLFHLSDGKWEVLETNIMDGSSDSVVFVAITHDLSLFAVASRSAITRKATDGYDFIVALTGLANCNNSAISGTSIASSDSFLDGNLLVQTSISYPQGVAMSRAGVGIEYIAPRSGRLKIETDVTVNGFDEIVGTPFPFPVVSGGLMGLLESGVEIRSMSIDPWNEETSYTSFRTVEHSPLGLDSLELFSLAVSIAALKDLRYRMFSSGLSFLGLPFYEHKSYDSWNPITDSNGNLPSLEIDVSQGQELFICVGIKSAIGGMSVLPSTVEGQVQYGRFGSTDTRVQEIRISYLSSQPPVGNPISPTSTPAPKATITTVSPQPTVVPTQQPCIGPWAIGQRVSLRQGAQIHTGSSANYPVHTIVPQDNWPVDVIGGPQCVNGEDWWDISRQNIDGGGTGWVNRVQAEWTSTTPTPAPTSTPPLDGIELCDGANFGPPCQTFTYTSNGTCIDLSGMNDRTESLRFNGSYVGQFEAILFSDNACGRYIARYGHDAADLGALNNQTSSIRIERLVPPTPPLPTPPPSQMKPVIYWAGTNRTNFDGVTDFVDCGTSPSFEFSAMTLAADIYVPANQDYGAIISKWDSQPDHGTFVLSVSSRFQTISLMLKTSGGNQAISAPFNKTDTWVRVVATYDGNSTATLFIDGAKVVQRSISGLSRDQNSHLVFGNTTRHSWQPYKGGLKNVIVYNTVVTPAIVARVTSSCDPTIVVPTPTLTPTPQPTSTPNSTPVPIPTPRPTYTAMPTPTQTPAPVSTPQPTNTPTPSPTYAPTNCGLADTTGDRGTIVGPSVSTDIMSGMITLHSTGSLNFTMMVTGGDDWLDLPEHSSETFLEFLWKVGPDGIDPNGANGITVRITWTPSTRWVGELVKSSDPTNRIKLLPHMAIIRPQHGGSEQLDVVTGTASMSDFGNPSTVNWSVATTIVRDGKSMTDQAPDSTYAVCDLSG